MKKILLTGMSGTGKSSVIDRLAASGHRAVDLDGPRWSVYDEHGDWIWREGEIEEILHYVDTVEPRLRAIAAYEVDTKAPLASVVATVLALGVGCGDEMSQ